MKNQVILTLNLLRAPKQYVLSIRVTKVSYYATVAFELRKLEIFLYKK